MKIKKDYILLVHHDEFTAFWQLFIWIDAK